MALPLYIPRCECHFPSHGQPLRVQIEGPLVAIQRLLPDIQWHLDPSNGTFPQPAGLELARLTYQQIYDKGVYPEISDDLVVQDEYLGLMPKERPRV